ncbi:MAG: WD40/YVTN/BNR-like repeat-containing protein [Acidimicrobiales bacterium]
MSALSTGCASASDWVSFDPQLRGDASVATTTTGGDAASNTGSNTGSNTDPNAKTGAAPFSTNLWTPLGEPGAGGRITALAVDPGDPQTVLVGGDMLGIGLSTDGARTWQTTSGLTHSEIARISFHPAVPGEVWAATMGGPFVSRDGGAHWQARRDGLPPSQVLGYAAPFEEILFDPANPDRLIGLEGSHRQWEAPEPTSWGGVWESADHGGSWVRVATLSGTGSEGVNIIDGAWLPDGTLLVVLLDQGIYRSEDGGRTWRPSSEGLAQRSVRELAVHPTDPNVLWAAVAGSWQGEQALPGGIWRSGDGGHTWAASSRGLDQLPTVSFQAGDGATDASTRPGPEFLPNYQTIAVAATNGDLLLTSNQAFGRQAVFRSDNGGASWTEVVSSRSINRPDTAYSTPLGAGVSVFAPSNADVAYLGNDEFVLATNDGGDTWRDATSDRIEDGTSGGRGFSGLVATGIEFGPRPGEVMVCGFDGANPLTATDGGRRWSRPMVGINEWGGCLDAAYSRSEPGRRYVLLGQAGIFGGVATIAPDGSVRLAVGPSAGLPEHFSQSDTSGSLEVIAGEDGIDIVAVTVGGALYRSVDGATRFERAAAAPSLGPLAADGGQPGVLYGAGTDGVHRSADAGATWEALDGPSDAVRLVHSPADQRLYAVVWRTQGAGVWRLEGQGNGGRAGAGSWTPILDQATSHDLAVDPTDPDHLVVATNDHPYRDLTASVGVLESFDGGLSWTNSTDGVPMARVAVAAFDPATPGRLVIGTYGRGFFQRTAVCGDPADGETRC